MRLFTRSDHDDTATPESQARPAREQLIGDGIAWTARWSLRWVVIALGAVLFGLVVQQTWVAVLPVILALIVATVLTPLCAVLRDRVRLPSGLAAAIALLGSIGTLVGVGIVIAPSVAGQADDIVRDTASGLEQLQDWVQQRQFVSSSQIDSALQKLQDEVQGSVGSIASGVLSGLSAVTDATITLVLTLVLTFLFLKDGRGFLPWLRRLCGPRVGGHVTEVATRSWNTVSSFIRTQALVSLIDAVFIGVGLLLVGVPLAIPLAVLTFFGGFVPIVGAVVVGAVSVLVALVSNGPTGALIILAVVLAVQQLEGNVLSPWLQSQSVQLPAAVVLLSVTVGSSLFGITGAFFAVPVAAVAAVCLRYLDEQVDLRAAPDTT